VAGQALQVGGRVGQAVDVVDPQPVDQAVGDQPQRGLVGQPEHLGVLLADPDQLVDGEEAAVVAVDRGAAPLHQLVVLLLEPVGARGEGEAVLVVADPALAGLELAGDPVERPAEDRQPHPPAARRPVDVEHPRER
jgi:hypothetical protein